jgi:RNA polymerase sigma-70 factor (ECF subfamily)
MNYSLLETEILLKLLSANDEQAFKAIYLRFWKQLYLQALKKVHVKETAEELVQNILVTLWANRHSANIDNLENYLKTAVKYQVINYIKLTIVKERKIYQTISQKSTNISSDNPDTGIIMRELSQAIENAIQSLPEKTQAVFRLSRHGNHSVKDISAHLNISEKAVEYHITKSLKQVRSHLKDYVVLFPLIVCLGIIF